MQKNSFDLIASTLNEKSASVDFFCGPASECKFISTVETAPETAPDWIFDQILVYAADRQGLPPDLLTGDRIYD